MELENKRSVCLVGDVGAGIGGPEIFLKAKAGSKNS